MGEFIPLLLLLLSSLLLTAAGASASSSSNNHRHHHLLLDSAGEAVRRGQLYHVKSVMRGPVISGLTLETVNQSCPLHVAQEPFDPRVTRPVAFFPENPNDDTVLEGRTLYISFNEPTECTDSNVWTLDTKTGYVTAGGSASSAIGPHYSRFAIYRSGGGSGSSSSEEEGYEIRLCPCSVGSGRPSCRMLCGGSLGVQGEGGRSRLTFYDLIGVRGNSPLIVHFAKVKPEEEPVIIRSVVIDHPN